MNKLIVVMMTHCESNNRKVKHHFSLVMPKPTREETLKSS